MRLRVNEGAAEAGPEKFWMEKLDSIDSREGSEGMDETGPEPAALGGGSLVSVLMGRLKFLLAGSCLQRSGEEAGEAN